MNKIWKYLIILAIVLLISMGGVYASDNNQSSDDVMGVTMDDADDLVAVDTSVADEDKVVDVEKDLTADENLTKDQVVTDSANSSDFKASSLKASSGSDGVLGASGDNDVLAADVGGSNYQVPVEVSETRSQTLGLRWLVNYARLRGGHTMAQNLADEIIDASNGTGNAVKKREDTHRMAEANKAFAHYRW